MALMCLSAFAACSQRSVEGEAGVDEGPDLVDTLQEDHEPATDPVIDVVEEELVSSCGDGVLDDGEECDDGDANSDELPDACRTDCQWAHCTDGVVDTGEICDDGNDVLWDGCDDCSIVEFQVNTEYVADQTWPAVAMGTDGRLVFVWQSLDQDGDGYGILGRCYSPEGVPGDEFLVNENVLGDQQVPDVSIASDGQFVVLWESYEQVWAGRWSGTYRLFNPDCTPAGPEMVVEAVLPNLDVSSLSASWIGDGSFVITWSRDSPSSSTDGLEVEVAHYDSGGSVVSPASSVNVYDYLNQWLSQVDTFTTGEYLIVYNSMGLDGGDAGVFGRYYDALDVPRSGEIQMNTFILASQRTPSLAISNTDEGMVVWMSFSQDSDRYGVFGQRIDDSGSTLGVEIQLNSYVPGDQYYPAVASADDEGYVVTWMSEDQDGDDFGIFIKRFDTDGSLLSEEFQANVHVRGLQGWPDVSATPTGQFVVVWLSEGQDGDAGGVFAQRFDDAGNALGTMPW